jgi:Flp pilus assembly protein TadD/thiol-disulfide isomerase/thioredoxin
VVENNSTAKRFLRVRLDGRQGLADSLGAFVKVEAGGVTQQDYTRLTDGFQTQVPFDLHFGLGEAALVDRLTVTWPGGETQSVERVPSDRLVTIRRGKAGFESQELPRWTTGPSHTLPAFSYDLAVKRLEGGEAPLAAKGKPAVINFWSPTCAPCKQEMPALASLAAAFRDRAQFAGVSVESTDLDSVRAAAKASGVPYPQFLADDRLLKSFFGPAGDAPLPSTFVFDGDGALRRIFRRAVTEPEMNALLDSFGDVGTGANDLDQRGLRAQQMGNLEEALRWFEKALVADPESEVAMYHSGLALQALGRDDEALTRLTRSVELNPDHCNGWLNLGSLLRKKGDLKGAIDKFQRARVLRPDVPAVLVHLGIAASMDGQKALALECFEHLVKVDGGNPTAWGMKGEFHFVNRQLFAAKKCFAKALELDPEEPRAKRYGAEIEKLEKEGR